MLHPYLGTALDRKHLPCLKYPGTDILSIIKAEEEWEIDSGERK